MLVFKIVMVVSVVVVMEVFAVLMVVPRDEAFGTVVLMLLLLVVSLVKVRLAEDALLL